MMRAHRRAGLLLEVMLALVLLVGAGLAVLSLLGESQDALARLREKQFGADLVRSTIARIETGMRSAEALSGPVTRLTDGDPEIDTEEESGLGWEVRIQTEPSAYDGLVRMRVAAVRVRGDESREVYAVHQLVRVGSSASRGGGGGGGGA